MSSEEFMEVLLHTSVDCIHETDNVSGESCLYEIELMDELRYLNFTNTGFTPVNKICNIYKVDCDEDLNIEHIIIRDKKGLIGCKLTQPEKIKIHDVANDIMLIHGYYEQAHNRFTLKCIIKKKEDEEK